MSIKNILIVTGWSFNDALIQTYTLPYVKIIKSQLPENSKIYLYTQRQKSYYTEFNKNERAKKELEKENIIVLEQEYHNFGIKAILSSSFSILKLISLVYKRNISKIHAWCTPAGSLAYVLSIITRRPLIIDSYEPHAEAMVENGTWKKSGLAFKLLFLFEKLQTKRAKVCIGLTEKTPEYALNAYGVVPKKHYVKPACVNFDMFDMNHPQDFSLINEPANNDKIICIYAGKVGGIYLEKEIFDFFRICTDYWGEKFKAIMLTNTPTEEIEKYIANSQLSKNSILYREVPHREVVKYMTLADFALNPVKPVPTKRYCTSIKDGEYWAMGLPVVITPNISDDSEIIKTNDIGSVIESFDNQGYLNAIKKMDALLKNHNKKDIKHKIKQVAIKHRDFSIAEKIYSEIYR